MTSARTGVPLLSGLVVGLCLALFLLSPEERPTLTCEPSQSEREFVDASEHWTVHVDQLSQHRRDRDPTPKVVRPRFAASELNIRERAMVDVLVESSLAVALNTSLGRHVPRIHLFADSARLDNELSQLSNLSPYIPVGCLSFQSMHNNYDWFLIVKDSTYINPFALKRLLDQLNWNEPLVMGDPGEDGLCRLEAGVLLSHPALSKLIQERSACNAGQVDGESDQLAFEKCIRLTTAVSCTSSHKGATYNVWRIGGTQAAHDQIGAWRNNEDFNQSLAVTRLLSDADAAALHDHFMKVEMAKLDKEIVDLEKEVDTLMLDTKEGPTWPAAVPPYSKPPNRYQLPTWEFFTTKDIFRSEPNQNVRPLEGKDLEDVNEVIAAARRSVEDEEPELQFEHMRNGRLFDPKRGMDYMVDLVYKSDSEEDIERRVHLSRMIASTQMLDHVPYVKEDTDVTIVVPVNHEDEVLPSRRLLARHAILCNSTVEEARKTRVVIALSPLIDPRSAAAFSNDLEALRKICHRSGIETDVITVHSHESGTGSSPESAALDESIDRYGANNIFIVLSPHADVQREFLDRARINTIKKYQVFFPVPFVEFHPTISRMDVLENEIPSNPQEARDQALNRLRDVHPPKRKRPLIVQKDNGRFDSQDYSVVCLYGSDYVALRSKLTDKHSDLISMFLNQRDIHVLRAIEPTLRIRYHQRSCEDDLDAADFARCTSSKREGLASKNQLARLLFHEE